MSGGRLGDLDGPAFVIAPDPATAVLRSPRASWTWRHSSLAFIHAHLRPAHQLPWKSQPGITYCCPVKSRETKPESSDRCPVPQKTEDHLLSGSGGLQRFSEIDDLTPGDFEQFVADVFAAAGWTGVELTVPNKEYEHGDGGVDIFAKREGRRFAIEVKQRNPATTVGITALNQLVTGARLADVSHLILVTNAYFTSEVRVRALKLGVELVDRDRLESLWIERHSEIGRRIKPRVYQQQVIDEVLAKYDSGTTRFLLEMATGLGKTYTVALLLKELLRRNHGNAPKRLLFVAHQVELILQTMTAFKNVFGVGTYSYSACFAGATPEDTDFVFATFDTLFTKLPSLPPASFDFVVVDEAHHTPARTYATVVQHFDPGFLIGLTATPQRSDNRNVHAFFGGKEGHVGKFDLAWGLKNRKLAFPIYNVMLDDLDEAKIRKIDATLSLADLDRRLFLHRKDQEVVDLIDQTISEKKIERPKAIVFCRNIRQIGHLIQFFPPGTATFVHSRQTGAERRENIRLFREQDYRYILVCDLFNEGVDIPETNILAFLRYTGSRTVWLQQLGRGLRRTKNKEVVHVLDFVGSLDRLVEINALVSEVKAAAAEVDLDEPGVPAAPIHNSGLDVNYNRTAADVLSLIEELKYQLKPKEDASATLRAHYEAHGVIPEPAELRDVTGLAPEQIATFFKSYASFVEAALPGVMSTADTLERVRQTAVIYHRTHQIDPSPRALALATLTNGLMFVVEEEIESLCAPRGYEAHLRDWLGSVAPTASKDSAPGQPTERTKNSALVQAEQTTAVLLAAYTGKISSFRDLSSLTREERVKIRDVFGSEGALLAALRNNY